MSSCMEYTRAAMYEPRSRWALCVLAHRGEESLRPVRVRCGQHEDLQGVSGIPGRGACMPLLVMQRVCYHQLRASREFDRANLHEVVS
jgi:hypothetical protein